jgi:hypothetical protein
VGGQFYLLSEANIRRAAHGYQRDDTASGSHGSVRRIGVPVSKELNRQAAQDLTL